MKLFSEKFEGVNSDKDFNLLCNKYPKYDPAYLCQSTYKLRRKIKEWMEELWKQYEPYSDSHFLEEFKRQFTQRSWELYLGSTFLNHDLILEKNSNKGPDFKIKNRSGIETTFIEAISVTKGAGSDKVPDMLNGVVRNVPIDQISLRISSALYEKYKKYLSYIEKKIINDKCPYVIAIDRSECGLGDALGPQILKVLFGVGDLALRIQVEGKPVKNPERFWTHQPIIKKQNGELISMNFFDDPEHSGISAVIYSKDHIINSPRSPLEMGENFYIVHNPNAKNPLPNGFFPFGEEYIADQNLIIKVREHRNYTEPNPFEYFND